MADDTATDPRDLDPVRGDLRDQLLELSILVVAGNDANSIPLTLLVKGAVVTGELIGPREFYRRYAEDISGLHEGVTDGMLNLRNMYLDWGKESAEKIEQEYPKDLHDPSRRAAQWLHLKSASIMAPGGAIPTTGGFLLRIRMASVDAVAIGARLAASRP